MKHRLPDPRTKLGLRPLINVAGTMTDLGASIVVPSAIEAINDILPHFVEIHDLQRKACEVISRLTGSEAGFVTASASAGITISVAAAMTGLNLSCIEQLPDTTGMKNEVLIQVGHMVFYGAHVEQAIRLAGAKVVPVGSATRVEPYQIEGKISDCTVAAIYVVTHHAVDYGMVPLQQFARICHKRDVPVIADLASEYDLRKFLKEGTDIAIYSAHKFLGGPTAGIVAGSKELIKAAFFQNYGIARGMKVGKESIVGTMAALEAWEKRDHQSMRERETQHLKLWLKEFSKLPGVTAELRSDPTNNPLDRLCLEFDPNKTGITAWELADRLAAGSPPIIVRDHEIEHGFIYLDPCNLHPGESEIVAQRVLEELDSARKSKPAEHMKLTDRNMQKHKSLMSWPD